MRRTGLRLGPTMIVIHAAAGAQLGIGHLSRCASLGHALAARGLPVILLAETARLPPAMVAMAGCPVARVGDRAAALARRAALAAAGAAVLVTDLLDLTAADAARARAPGFRRLVHLGDSAGSYGADLVIDGDLVPQTTAAAGSRRLAGPRWHILRPDVVAARPLAAWSGERARRVLIVLGGADPGAVTECLLAGTGLGDLALTVALGPAMPASRRQALIARHGARHRLLDATMDLVPHLLAADLVVTLGGLTSYEAMGLGRPVAACSWAHMAAYVDRLAGAGVLADLGPPSAASAALGRLAGAGATLRRLAARGYTALDGGGAARVVAEIEHAWHGAA